MDSWAPPTRMTTACPRRGCDRIKSRLSRLTEHIPADRHEKVGAVTTPSLAPQPLTLPIPPNSPTHHAHVTVPYSVCPSKDTIGHLLQSYSLMPTVTLASVQTRSLS